MAMLDFGVGYEQFLIEKRREPRPTEFHLLHQVTISVAQVDPEGFIQLWDGAPIAFNPEFAPGPVPPRGFI